MTMMRNVLIAAICGLIVIECEAGWKSKSEREKERQEQFKAWKKMKAAKANMIERSEDSSGRATQANVQSYAMREAERDECAKGMLPDFCRRCGVDLATVSIEDVCLINNGSNSDPRYVLRWTDAGRKRQLHIVTTNLLAVLKQDSIPKAADKIEADLMPILSSINSNGLLRINWDVVSDDYKYEALFRRNSVYFSGSSEVKRDINMLTNAYAKVNGKSIGPIFTIHDDNGEKQISFDKNIYCEILENYVLEDMSKRGSTEMSPFILLPNPNIDIVEYYKSCVDEGRIYVHEEKDIVDLHGCTDSGYGHSSFYVKRCEKFANEYAKAMAIIREEEEKLAARKRLAEEYMNMPETEKFPLLSVQPKPQMLMKGIQSGVSMKWIEGWLLSNKIEFSGPNKSANGNEYIAASFYDNGELIRKVTFWFTEKVLTEIVISPRKTPLPIDVVIQKYSKELGPTAQVIRKEKDKPEMTANGCMAFFMQDWYARIANADVGVSADYKMFVGFLLVNEETAQSFKDMAVEEAMQYLKFDKSGLADLIVGADGTIIKCTEFGNLVKEHTLKMLPDFKKSDGLVYKIGIWDVKLNEYFKQKEKMKAEEAKRKEEEDKKAREAAALDF